MQTSAGELRFCFAGEHQRVITCRLMSHPSTVALCEAINSLSNKSDIHVELGLADSLIYLGRMRQLLESRSLPQSPVSLSEQSKAWSIRLVASSRPSARQS